MVFRIKPLWFLKHLLGLISHGWALKDGLYYVWLILHQSFPTNFILRMLHYFHHVGGFLGLSLTMGGRTHTHHIGKLPYMKVVPFENISWMSSSQCIAWTLLFTLLFTLQTLWIKTWSTSYRDTITFNQHRWRTSLNPKCYGSPTHKITSLTINNQDPQLLMEHCDGNNLKSIND